MDSLTLLGTGTCQVEHERRASSVLLELADTYVLFDCGHGVLQRLLEAGVQHNQVTISCFHTFIPIMSRTWLHSCRLVRGRGTILVPPIFTSMDQQVLSASLLA